MLISSPAASKRAAGWGRWIKFPYKFESYLDNQKKKKKAVAQHITHVMCTLVLLLTISVQLVESCVAS